MVTRRPTSEEEDKPGVAVDVRGVPAKDPSENVRDMMEKGDERLDAITALNWSWSDKLDMAMEKLWNEKVHGRDGLCRSDNDRISELRLADKELHATRSYYQDKLSVTESKRIDAILANSAQASATALERQAQSATALAAQVIQTADTLRNLVSSTAQAQALLAEQFRASVDKRLTDVERLQNLNTGRQGVSEPLLIELIAEVKKQGERTNTGSGNKEGVDATWVKVIAVGGLALAGLAFWDKQQPSPPPQTPIVVLQPNSSGTAPIVVQPQK